MSEILEKFIKKINNFNELSSSELIPFFIYYLTIENDNYIVSNEIKECFEKLALKPYSNISAYLNKKSSGKDAIFLKKQNTYKLTRLAKINIGKNLHEIIIEPTNELIDLSIFYNTPFYIKKMAEQMTCCYDNGLYDACLVMMRKLVETLIIECFERHGIAEKIKDTNGHFYYLSDLIPLLFKSSYWVASRNIEKNIKEVKKYGDLSAHHRRFIANKKDIDSFKFELRQAIQEIIYIIDYSNWDRESKVQNL